MANVSPGEWQDHCTDNHGDLHYEWVPVSQSAIGPLPAALIAPLFPPTPPGTPLAPPGPTAVIAACAVGGAIGTIQGSTEPSAPCTESNVGEVERTYNFELSPVWLQILMGPPVCEVQVSTYQCSRV